MRTLTPRHQPVKSRYVWVGGHSLGGHFLQKSECSIRLMLCVMYEFEVNGTTEKMSEIGGEL